MSTSFGEYTAPTDTIAAILASYPFSVGIFRELIQNSDDAKASKQIFLLDSRRHPTESLYHPKLRETQGPALLAFNDALLSEDDWQALQTIHRSSKRTDTTKIGKYGIGFRSCYHVTDNPQILSGPSLAILDPHHEFTVSGGAKFDIVQPSNKYADQLSSFDWFLPDSSPSEPFSGSIIRLPLRTPDTMSSISTKIVDADEIHKLFEDFVMEEIDISLLFLKNVSSIEVHEIGGDGNRKCLAKAHITRDPEDLFDMDDESHRTHRSTVVVDTLRYGSVEKTWRILHSTFPQSQVIAHLLECNPISILSKHKLLPEVAIAMPLSILTEAEYGGRLFTYLPLPLRTGFPGHVHGLFALTQSRQNLRNSGEIGIAQGSDDSVLVKWNNLLFGLFLPRAWSIFLRLLIKEDHLLDVFRAWPRSQNAVECGDSTYWQSFPSNLLVEIAKSGSPVWPVFDRVDSKISTEFADFESVLVASPDAESEILRAFGNAGLKITQPPEYIIQLLLASHDIAYTLLTPDIAHEKLLDHISQLDSLGTSDRALIMEFLLSNQNLMNIIRLPLVQLVNGQYVALTSNESSLITHTMLDRRDIDVFGPFDESAIALYMLRSQEADLFRTGGEHILNLRPLTPERVVEYLSLKDNLVKGFQERISDAVVEWFSSFWEWLGDWPARERLYPSIRQLYLLPSRNGVKSAENGIFSEVGVDPNLLDILEIFDICVVHIKFSQSARAAVNGYDVRVIKSLCDIHELLEQVQIDQHREIDRDAAEEILGHVVRCIPESFRRNGQLDGIQRRKLRALPIFPLLRPSTTMIDGSNALRAWGCIPEGKVVKGITNMAILPIIRDVLYLDGSLVDLALLPHLDPGSRPLSELDVLHLALDQLPEQSEHLQNAFVKYMFQNHDHLPPSLLQDLQEIRFVISADGTMQSPGNMVDPNSTLADIFTLGDRRLPCLSRPGDLVRDLSSLRLFRSELTADIVQERIQFISLNSSSVDGIRGIARNLLSLLYSSRFDCTQLNIPLEAKWLPTDNGILGPQECRDHGSNTPELFDEILSLVDRNIAISSSLRRSLGWDAQIPLSILSKQLALVKESHGQNRYKKLKVLIKEFGRRLLTDEQIHDLRIITSDWPWIPISSGFLATTSHAIFLSASAFPGFHQVSPTSAEPTRRFLLRMGCTDRPSRAALLTEIKNLGQQSPCAEIAEQTICILQELPKDLTDEERAGIFVPDSHCQLYPIARLLYNDIGNRHLLVTHDGFFLAHHKVDEKMANKLRMERLGLKCLGLNNPRIDMGEQLTTRIRNVLAQYTEQQIFTEFLANAADAEATEFGILVDEYPAPDTKLLSSAMAPFQSCPSLVIYNNGTFTKKDFEGICRVGTGGKEGKTSTIGQFGLGVLSMFHFTEMVMIVSGDQVLFLDPSKTHLVQDWTSLLVPLGKIKRFYSDHLAPLDGLFGFHESSTFYDGTLFRLPLRNTSHTNSDSILDLKIPRTAHDVWNNVVKPYRKQAQQSLLFTKIKSIETCHRNSAGSHTQGWSLFVSHDAPHLDGDYKSEVIHISGHLTPNTIKINEDWSIALVAVQGAELPSEFGSLVGLRSPIVVGLAAHTNAAEPGSAAHSLFSTLPLPIETTLPVHLTAPFILASDRRNIRFDTYGNLESKYNQWLLSCIVPPLYLFLLQEILRHHGCNKNWWPGCNKKWWPGSHQDSITCTSVDEFYSTHLANAERRIYSSLLGSQSLCLKDAVFWGNLKRPISAAVAKVLQALRPPQLVELPFPVHLCREAKIKFVDPAFVRAEILRTAVKFVSRVRPSDPGPSCCLEMEEMECLVRFMLRNQVQDLVGLPLLPLADGSFTTFERAGSQKLYYAWKPLDANHLFFRHCLIHPDFFVDQLFDLDLNVAKLTGSAIRELLRDCIPEGKERDATPAEEVWISAFWAEYEHFKVGYEYISTFPLVRTMRKSFYVSLEQCKLSTVIQTDHSQPEWLWGCLDKLGATIVDSRNSSDFPPTLRNILQVYFPSFHFRQVLSFFKTVKFSISRRFNGLDNATHQQFADWARRNTVYTPKDLVATARSLPIWPEPHASHPLCFRSASEITMLPSGVTRDIAIRFMRDRCVEYQLGLVYLEVQTLNFRQFRDRLRLPRILDPNELPDYEHLLIILLSNRASDPRDILVPNGNRVLVQSSTLYARDPLFVAAFGANTERFVLEAFRHLETSFHSFGLKRQVNLNLDMFKACAAAIHGDLFGMDRVARAGIVFQAYGEDLPMHIRSNEQSLWRQLDSLCFIPRDDVRQRLMMVLNDSEYVEHLPTVIAPNKVVRAEFEAIAWTQRALFLIPPDERVLLANRDLGKPSIHEVVLHLRTLALRVAIDNPLNEHVLSDLEATYKWLNTQVGEAGNIMIQHHAQPLFLNIDDPLHDAWTWHCADELFFNISDSRGLYAVRKFLEPFKDLLRVSGVEEILNPPCPETQVSSADMQLTLLRLAFDSMRQERTLTDVVFLALNGDEFPAHRSLLVSTSEYFRYLFCSSFREAGPASAENPVEVSVNHSSLCLKSTLDYIYVGSMPDVETLGLTELIEFISLAIYWEITEFSEAIQAKIISKRLINQCTFEEIREWAEEVEAKMLIEACQIFEQANMGVIRKVNIRNSGGY